MRYKFNFNFSIINTENQNIYKAKQTLNKWFVVDTDTIQDSRFTMTYGGYWVGELPLLCLTSSLDVDTLIKVKKVLFLIGEWWEGCFQFSINSKILHWDLNTDMV